MGKVAKVGDMIKRRSLRSKGGEDGRCHREQSGGSATAGGGMMSMSSNRWEGELWPHS